MKLIHYTIGRLSVVLFFIMLFWTVFFYFNILDEVRDETDDSLKNYKKLIIKQALVDSVRLSDHVDILTRYHIKEIPEQQGRAYDEHFITTEVFNEYEMDEEPVRMLKTAFRTDKGKYYELTIMTSTLEEDDMLESIFWSIVYLYIALLLCVLIVTHWVFRKSLSPFYRLLAWMDGFTFGGKREPLQNNTRVTEFRRLNETIAAMVERNERIFQEQKQFIENASHELQTPLAICRGKLEFLSEQPGLTEGHLQELGEIHETMGRIVKLNKSLLLLSRIENGQYSDVKEVDFNGLIRKMVDDLTDVYEFRNICIELTEQGAFLFRMNDTLASVLITNLLKNAIVHSAEGSKIEVLIASDGFSISNSAEQGGLDEKQIFRRFYNAGTKKNESTGLGLAIVKSIADTCRLHITYHYDGNHHFDISKV